MHPECDRDKAAPMRLLLVDDEAPLRRNLAKLLARRGFSIEQAASGEECLAVLDTAPVDVVVLDVKMPGIDGIETLARIKRGHPRIEVILLTGHATTRDGVEGIKLGAFDYLSKPVEFEHLLSTIRHAGEKIQRIREQQQEAEFRRKLQQQMIATERLASLGTLAVGVAHEINNPLAIIKQSIRWMQLLMKRPPGQGIPARSDFENAMQKIDGAVERARRITHQLLGFVKKNDSVFAPIPLADLIAETLPLVERESTAKGIDLVRELEPDIDPVWTDPYLLKQVLVNLLVNAIHATPEGGRITISVTGGTDGITLTVGDTGSGIAAGDLDRIFEPFFTTKGPDEGTGLGLFVTRGILGTLGGTIRVESRPGRGANFIIALPRHPNGWDVTDG